MVRVVPLFDGVKVYGEAVSTVLAPGERLLAIGGFHTLLNGDESKLERRDHELTKVEQRFLREHGRRMPSSDRWFQGVDWTGIHVNSDRFERLLSGLVGIGAVDSYAGRLWRSTKQSRGLLQWAVTDRRFLVLDSTPSNDYSIPFSVDRADVRSARRRGKLLFQWGRVELRFVDGSMFSFLAAMLDVVAARNLVRALSGTSQRGN
jgi:hypothetical protein